MRDLLDLAIDIASNEIRHRARLVRDYRDLPEVDAHGPGLGNVFVNLLLNAAQAIPEGHAQDHEIKVVACEDPAGRAMIEFRDSGSGIAPETLPHIFDPFFTTKPVGSGTGLGLSMCHGTITRLGGEIIVESMPGKGSVFRVL